MKRLLIDMDDVMADTFEHIVNKVNERRGTNWTKEAVNSTEMMAKFNEDYQPVRNFLWEKGFFADIPLMPDAQEVVEKLHQKYEIFIVSAATEFPLSMAEKLTWLEKYFPYIGWAHTVFCGHKYMIKADYLIDDHEKNLAKFTGTPLLFNAPHNLGIEGYLRMNSWKDVANYLL
ncbi:MAG: 5'(3')-deoxyribonucleotidase [Bacteroidota bacterium]